MKYFVLIVLISLASCKSKKETTTTESGKTRKRKILTEVVITAISITQFPKYAKDGEKWDAYAPFASDPDLFTQLTWNQNVIHKSETRQECVYGTPVPFSTGLPFVIKPFDQPLLFEVFDEDGISSNDNMGYFNFVITQYKDKPQIELIQGELKVMLSVEWKYDNAH